MSRPARSQTHARSRTPRWPLIALIALSAAGLAAWRWWPSPPARPNVLVITMDTTRADRLGAYGFALARTPHLDRLAAEGIRASNAVATAPITMPSHASIFTGLNPPTHGVRDNGAYTLGADAVTLAERLKAVGYETRAFVSAVVLSRRYGLDQGFDHYDDDLWAADDPKLFMTGRVLAWLDERRARPTPRPFFAWVHYFDPHQPMTPPPEDRVLAPTPYDAEIASMDRAIGRIIEQLRATGLLDDTIVVAAADHGESLGEHQEKTHALFVYRATVHVPLIVRYPARLPASVYDGPVRSIDVVPTLLGLLGLPGGSETEGTDLTRAFRGEVAAPDLPQYSESLVSELGFGMAPLHAIRQDNFTWIRAPKPELYDLTEDPGERRNVYKPGNSRVAALDEALQRLMDGTRARAVSSTGDPMSKETFETLRSLGYVAPAAERTAMGGMDPKDGLPIYNKLEDARHFAQVRRWEDAERLLREIIAAVPAHTSARSVLGLTLMRQGRLDEAAAEYERTLAYDPGQARLHAAVGGVRLMQERLDEAEQFFTQAVALSPGFVEALTSLGFIHALRDNEPESRRYYERAIAADPGFPLVYRRLADLYYERNDMARALEHYELTLARQASDFQAAIQAGNSARRVGQPDRARAYYERAAALRPDSWIPTYNLACLRAITGDAPGALALLAQAVDRGFADVTILERDTDLDGLRRQDGFAAIRRKTAAKAAALLDDAGPRGSESPAAR